ncbi:Release factor glutamine methyltransferase, partial [Durusdinium trenchii]
VITTGLVKSSVTALEIQRRDAFVISEPLSIPVAPGQVPLFSAKDPTKRVARAVLSIGRLFSAEAQAVMARSLAQRVVALLREGPGPELHHALDAL